MAAKSKEFSNLVINRYANVSDKYEVIEQIGRGSYADVIMAKDVKTKEKMAIKVIKLDFLEEDMSRKLIELLMKEAALMSKLDHPNILKYHECFQDNNNLCIVLDYCEETLTKVLRTHLNDKTRPSEQLIIEWFYKLSLGLDYLHDRNIIHRDIKPMNILFKNSEIKIADFGESRLKSQATMTVRGTPAYMSPEMLRNEKFNEKTDIWSLGCVFYEIYYLEQAFDGDSEYTLRKNILNRKIKLLNSDNSEIANLIDMMLDTNKDERISIKEVLSHKVLKNFTKDKKDKTAKNDNQVVNRKEVAGEDETKANKNKEKVNISKMIEQWDIRDTNKKDEKQKQQQNQIEKKVEVAEEYEDISKGQKVDIPELIDLCRSDKNNYKKIRELIIKQHANVNYKNEEGETALIWASRYGHKEVVALLIQNGALVNEKNESCWTALMAASIGGHKEVVALLIQNRALVNKKNESDWTALMFASEKGHKEVVALLIQNGALVNEKRTWEGLTALILASEKGHKEVVALLIQNGALVNEKNESGWTALMKASWKGHKDVVALLIQNKALVNEKNESGSTALMEASWNGHKEVVALLILNEDLVNEKDEDGQTALMRASYKGHKEVVALLIQNGALVNEKDKYGYTALMKASYKGHKEVVALLIQNGALVNEKTEFGYTALMRVSFYGHKEVVALLIQNGALVNEKSNDGETALMSASIGGHKEVVALLIQNGALVNEKRNDGETALMRASERGHEEVVNYLKLKGAVEFRF